MTLFLNVFLMSRPLYSVNSNYIQLTPIRVASSLPSFLFNGRLQLQPLIRLNEQRR